jgi:hypothetical protein
MRRWLDSVPRNEPLDWSYCDENLTTGSPPVV